MIGTKIADATLISSPTGEELIPCSDGSGEAKSIKFSAISDTTEAIANANSAAASANSVATQVSGKIQEMQAAIEDAEGQLDDMESATSEATSSASSASSAASNANAAATACSTAASKAQQAAADCNTAYNKIGGVITQVNQLQTSVSQQASSISDLQDQAEEQEDTITSIAELANNSASDLSQLQTKAVTFASSANLPSSVTSREIHFVQSTGKTYIGIPSYTQTQNQVVLNWATYDIELNKVFAMTDTEGDTVYGIVTAANTAVKACTSTGTLTGRYYSAGSSSISLVSSESAANVRATQKSVTIAAAWKEI